MFIIIMQIEFIILDTDNEYWNAKLGLIIGLHAEFLILKNPNENQKRPESLCIK